MLYRLFCISMIIVLSSCASTPPAQIDDLCAIFQQKKYWHKAARKAEARWGVSIPILMAFIRHESAFRATAKPTRKRILWLLPGPRPSSAYGYAQALDGTWSDYKKANARRWAKRNDFSDAIDFVGWYNHNSWRKNGIAKSDAYRLYLAYHQGHGGYARGHYRNKSWLLAIARQVAAKANRYQQQINTCDTL